MVTYKKKRRSVTAKSYCTIFISKIQSKDSAKDPREFFNRKGVLLRISFFQERETNGIIGTELLKSLLNLNPGQSFLI